MAKAKLITASFDESKVDDLLVLLLNPEVPDDDIAAMLDSAVTWGGLGGGLAEAFDGPSFTGGISFLRNLARKAISQGIAAAQ